MRSIILKLFILTAIIIICNAVTVKQSKITTTSVNTLNSTIKSPSNCTKELTAKFEAWKKKFNKTYSDPQKEAKRREIFCTNYNRIKHHNSCKGKSYKRGPNRHSDKTFAERNRNLLGVNRDASGYQETTLKTSTERTTFVSKVSTTTKKSYYIKMTSANVPKLTTSMSPKITKSTSVQSKFTSRPRSTVGHSFKGSTTQAHSTINKRKTSATSTTKFTKKTTSTSTTTTSTTTSSTTTSTTTTTVKITTHASPEMLYYASYNQSIIPESLNYSPACTPVKDQYGCGACWAFSAIGVVEFWRNLFNEYALFSEQGVIDCNIYEYDCNGGWPYETFLHTINYGLSDGNLYEYIADKNNNCLADAFPSIITMDHACEINLKGDENLLMEILVKYGPVAAVINVIDSLYQYSSGVYYEPNCANDTYNHGIAIVGYGTDLNFGDYWIIRNSWSASWGINGYAWMARNKDNHCAIASFAIFPCREDSQQV